MTINIELVHTWTCDGCGVKAVACGEARDISVDSGFLRMRCVDWEPGPCLQAPEGWTSMSFGFAPHTKKADLCVDCASAMRRHGGTTFLSMLKAASLVFGTRPVLCVDAIVRRDGKYLLVRRKNPPEGWALAGGHMDPWEKAADAAARELLEETGLRAENVRLFKVYSDPDRDPRYHAVSLVHVVDARGEAEASDDAAEAAWFTREECVQLDYAGLLAFDHGQILDDFWEDQ